MTFEEWGRKTFPGWDKVGKWWKGEHSRTWEAARKCKCGADGVMCHCAHCWAMEAEAIKAEKSKWVSVKDRLPERIEGAKYSQVPCLVWINGHPEHLVFNHEHMCWDDSEGDDFYCAIGDVTHWQPITQPEE